MASILFCSANIPFASSLPLEAANLTVLICSSFLSLCSTPEILKIKFNIEDPSACNFVIASPNVALMILEFSPNLYTEFTPF